MKTPGSAPSTIPYYAGQSAAVAGLDMVRRRLFRSRRKPRRRLRISNKRKRRSRVRTRTRRTRRRVYQTNVIESRSTALKTLAKRPTALKLAYSAFDPVWYRFQNLSQYDTATGAIPIATRFDTTSNYRWLPLHVYDISCAPNILNTVLTYPTAGTALGTSTTQVISTTINGVTANGTSSASWNFESAANFASESAFRKGFHCHTSIHFNLYGVRKRVTKFIIELVQVKDEFADIVSGDNANVQKRKLIDWWTRTLIYSNLNAADPQTAHSVRVLKRYTCNISPTGTDDYGGEAAATPHMQTLHWFIKHNRTRRFDWLRSAPDAVSGQNWDSEVNSTIDTRIQPRKRLYLVVRALSPETRSAAGIGPQSVAADPISEPSYDIMMRNKWMYPT